MTYNSDEEIDEEVSENKSLPTSDEEFEDETAEYDSLVTSDEEDSDAATTPRPSM